MSDNTTLEFYVTYPFYELALPRESDFGMCEIIQCSIQTSMYVYLQKNCDIFSVQCTNILSGMAESYRVIVNHYKTCCRIRITGTEVQ